MNITFLVGNGFDLNLGLETRYLDFLKVYQETQADDLEHIVRFKKAISKDKDLWSNAELAFGEYTLNYKDIDEGAKQFCECHMDFCENLAKYLTEQERRLSFDIHDIDIPRDFGAAVCNYKGSLSDEQKDQVEASYSGIPGGKIYNFINFNYTSTLDNCVELVRETRILGNRKINEAFYENSIGDVLHVHGYTDREMVLGLNDESQIKYLELFNGEIEFYKDQIIKQRTNKMIEKYTDDRVYKLLNTSHLIYIYGMSIEETDALWWKRICDLMRQQSDLRVIIHKMDAPTIGVISTPYKIYEQKARQQFINYSEFDAETKSELANRVHIDSSNIFAKLNALAQKCADAEKESEPMKEFALT